MKPCCDRSPLYTLRRYDPIGRTLWVRDWFHGFTGRFVDPLDTQSCRMIVVGDRIYVGGPLVWTHESRPITYWNLACYGVDGALLWREQLGDDPAAVIDLAYVNDQLYAILTTDQELEPRVVQFNTNAHVVASYVPSGPFEIGKRFVVGDPSTDYPGILPAGLLTCLADRIGDVDPHGDLIGQVPCACYRADANEFAFGVNSHAGGVDGGTEQSITMAQSPAGSDYIILGEANWPTTSLTWTTQRYEGGGPNFVTPNELSPAPGGIFTASQFAPYCFPNVDTVIGQGSLIRWDGDGVPIWYRGLNTQNHVVSDETRLYAASQGGSLDRPSISRWSHDGEFLWGHSHNTVHQIALIDDRGIITTGNRVEYGKNEKQNTTEGSA